MKLSELKEHDDQLDEILPALAMGAARLGAGAMKTAGQVAKVGANAVGQISKGVANLATKGSAALQKGVQAAGNAVSAVQSGEPDANDPSTMAQHQQEVNAQKKEIQAAIQEKQKELQDLQKQLAQTK